MSEQDRKNLANLVTATAQVRGIRWTQDRLVDQLTGGAITRLEFDVAKAAVLAYGYACQ